MSLITKHNYEAFLLDYAEGNLSPESTAELMLFLENNPEFKEDLDDFDIIPLDIESTQFEEKEALKISEDKVTAVIFDDVAISEVEGENTPEQSKALSTFLAAHPEKQKEFALYQKTMLRPALIRFDDKKALLQEDKKAIPLYWWYSAAAAVILIVFLLNGVFTNDSQPGELKVADENLNLTEKGVQEENNTAEQSTYVAEQNEENQLEEKNEVDVVQVNNGEAQKDKKPEKKQPKFKQVPLKEPTAKQDTKLASKNPTKKKEEIIDSTATLEPIEEYYANQVKVTYEDDVLENTNNEQATTPGKKNSKFDVVRAAVKQQLKGLFGNAKKDLEVLTASADKALSKKNTK